MTSTMEFGPWSTPGGLLYGRRMSAVSRGLVRLLMLPMALLGVVGVGNSPASADPVAAPRSVDDSIRQATTISQILMSHDYVDEDADVLRLYQAFFARTPDIEGAKFWLIERRRNVTLDDMAYSFAESSEFRSTYGSTNDRDFVSIVYRNVLGREPDPEGLAYWISLVETGKLSRHGVVRWIAANDEFIAAHPFEKGPPTIVPVTGYDLPPPTVAPIIDRCLFAGTPLRLEPLYPHLATTEGSATMIAEVTGFNPSGGYCAEPLTNAEVSVSGLGPQPIVIGTDITSGAGQFPVARLTIVFEVPRSVLDDESAFQPIVTVALPDRPAITMTALLRSSDLTEAE